YFNKLGATSTNEMADHFYSFLLQKEMTTNINIMIETDIRKDIQDSSLPNSVRFWKIFAAGEWKPSSLKFDPTIIKMGEQYWISKQNIFLFYKQWCLDTGSSPTNDDYFFKNLKKHNIVSE